MKYRADRQEPRGAVAVALIRLAIVVVALLIWEYVPKITALHEVSPIFDPFFISSPSQVFERLTELATGSNGQPEVWSYLWDTLLSTFIGVAIGTLLGALGGLVLSNSPRVEQALSPFIAFFNSAPRIAFVPIFVIIAGPSMVSSVLTAVFVIFFIVFYNAYAGGISVPRATIQNAYLQGASGWEVMRFVRLPYVLVWTFTSLPNAISFGLVAVVTAEILTGAIGMGRLLFNSISSVDSTLTFAVVFILSIAGVVLVWAAERAQRHWLHWWQQA